MGGQSDKDISSYSDDNSSLSSCKSPEIGRWGPKVGTEGMESVSGLEGIEDLAHSPSSSRGILEGMSEMMELVTSGPELDGSRGRGTKRRRLRERKKRMLQTSTPLVERRETEVGLIIPSLLLLGWPPRVAMP